MMQDMQRPCALLFNFPKDSRCAKIESYLMKKGVAVRHVPPKEFSQPIGALLGLPGFSSEAAPQGMPFTDEMLLMSGFGQALLHEFLDFFSREQLQRVALKAMLTPSNAAWNAYELHRHLSAEHSQLSRLKR